VVTPMYRISVFSRSLAAQVLDAAYGYGDLARATLSCDMLRSWLYPVASRYLDVISMQ
jgi:hypothetical protein